MLVENTQRLSNLSGIFVDAACQVIETVSGIQMMPTVEKNTEAMEYSSILPLVGEVNGLFLVQSSLESLTVLTSFMAGLETEAIVQEDLVDCIGELANMICGLVKSRAIKVSLPFSLGTPFAIKGYGGIEFFMKKKSVCYQFCLYSGNISLSFYIILI